MEKKDRAYMLLGLRIVGDFGATIAIPVVLFVIVGQYIEARYGFGPWPTIIAFVLAAVLSGHMIYKKAKQYNIEYHNLEKPDDEKKK
ncbi:MAG: hypothetical protein A3J66_00730 [Candidatus Magasanikbacteria bacterium RIFCSPHIGHO2_02_FULL_47_14]|uniref:AtpZ/AtpI family protein n=1 Tax=Candidatus Magasanikbacteria bacterium RIFCSPHIGHO2_02_FULL_47_14 TaxID=1798680 RepID=A0A1F6LZ51_9BACT|nr:MAG: hypothetical protein A3J66_00730 [Candidatus Magasanikbacteria bacterium RIFCSPHIGHO2_02_FULL_47_14]